MAVKPKAKAKLSFVDIVLNADADIIKAAYEAKIKIDELLALREEAYQQIFELENQIEDVVGDPGVFAFPAPPCNVAGISGNKPSKRTTPKPKTPTQPKTGDTEKPAEKPEPKNESDNTSNQPETNTTNKKPNE